MAENDGKIGDGTDVTKKGILSIEEIQDGNDTSGTNGSDKKDDQKQTGDDDPTKKDQQGDNKTGDNKDGDNKDDGANTSEVSVDGVKYKLNADGAALNEKGEVIYSKEQLEALSGTTGADNKDDQGNYIPEPVVDEVQKVLGVTINDEQGKPKVYSDDIEGIVELIKDVNAITRQQDQRNFLASNTKVERYYKHLANGGTDETFFSIIKDDWKSIKIDDKNPTQHEEIITKALIKKGLKPEMASATARMYNEKGEGAKMAKELLDEQVAVQEIEKKREDETYQTNIKRMQDDRQQYLDTVDDLVNKKGQVGSFVIPLNERQKFFDYLFKPVKDNQSQDDLDTDLDPLDVNLQLTYLRFKNFNISSLVQVAAKEQRAMGLRDRITKDDKKQQGVRGTGSGNKPNGGGTGKIMSVEQIQGAGN